jgi:dTDP-L-rhamnose 4-epimerase
MHWRTVSTDVLITGGAGFIGSNLAKVLLRAGRSVAVVDSLHPLVHPPGEQLPSPIPGLELHLGDVTSLESMRALIRVVKPQTIVHLAAETGTGQSLHKSSLHAQTNVVGLTSVLDACTAAAWLPEHIVLTSTRAVYGDSQWQSALGKVFCPDPRPRVALERQLWDPVSPDGAPSVSLPSVAGVTPTNPTNVYGATKLAQEQILKAWAGSLDVSLSILRLQNVYGPGQSPSNSYTGVLTHFALQALRGLPVKVFEDGQILRDFVYIDDVIAALSFAIGAPPPSLRVVDVGSGTPTPILSAAAKICSFAGTTNEPVITGEYRLGDVRAAWCEPWMRLGGPTVETELDVGLQRMVEGVRVWNARYGT